MPSFCCRNYERNCDKKAAIQVSYVKKLLRTFYYVEYI